MGFTSSMSLFPIQVELRAQYWLDGLNEKFPFEDIPVGHGVDRTRWVICTKGQVSLLQNRRGERVYRLI